MPNSGLKTQPGGAKKSWICTLATDWLCAKNGVSSSYPISHLVSACEEAVCSSLGSSEQDSRACPTAHAAHHPAPAQECPFQAARECQGWVGEGSESVPQGLPTEGMQNKAGEGRNRTERGEKPRQPELRAHDHGGVSRAFAALHMSRPPWATGLWEQHRLEGALVSLVSRQFRCCSQSPRTLEALQPWVGVSCAPSQG